MIKISPVNTTPNYNGYSKKNNNNTQMTVAQNVQNSNISFKHKPFAKLNVVLEDYAGKFYDFLTRYKTKQNETHHTTQILNHLLEYNKKGRLLKDNIYDTTTQQLNEIVHYNYNSRGQLIQKVHYQTDDTTLKATELIKNDEVFMRTNLRNDGKIVDNIEEYTDGKLQKVTRYDNDGTAKSCVDYYKTVEKDGETVSTRYKTIYFQKDSNNVDCLREVDENGKTTKLINFANDSQEIKNESEYSYTDNGRIVKTTTYYPTGKSTTVQEYDNEDLLKKITFLHEDGSINYSEEYGNTIKKTYYNADGTIKSVEYKKYW